MSIRVLLFTFLALFANGASAILIDNGSVTRDTVSGLDWLDVTETFGLTYNEVENGVGNSWFADGWRYAVLTEVLDLVERETGAVFGCAGCPSSASVDLSDANKLISLFGSNSDGWINSYFDDGPISEHAGQFAVVVDPPNYPSTIFLEAPNGIAKSVRNSGLGSLLVRSTQVPAPSTLLVFSIGLIGVQRLRG